MSDRLVVIKAARMSSSVGLWVQTVEADTDWLVAEVERLRDTNTQLQCERDVAIADAAVLRRELDACLSAFRATAYAHLREPDKRLSKHEIDAAVAAAAATLAAYVLDGKEPIV